MSAKVYSVISLIPQNGAKYLTTNLGYTLGRKKKKKKILLIDFDFNDPTLCHHFVKDSIYDLDGLGPFGANLKEEDFLNNITNTSLGFDVLKGSKLGRVSFFSKELIAKIINYAKSNYDYVLIVTSPDVKSSPTVVSLLNSDEVLMVVRNNYANLLKVASVINSIETFSRGKTIKIVENISNYNKNINIVESIKDYKVQYVGFLNFDLASIDNLDLEKKSFLKKKNINKRKFKEILKGLL